MAESWHQSMFTISIFIFCVFQFAEVTSTSFFSKQKVMCNDYERAALLQFKESFSINTSASGYTYAYPKTASWKLNASDNSTYDCCFWDGVECSDATGHVIGLHLSSSFLYGPLDIESSLFRLVRLQILDLSDNDFMHSRIPSRISNLSHVTSLNLSLSAFSGQIPKEISQLTQLASLDLSMNPLKLNSPSFEHLLQNLTGLEKLSLSYVNISAQVPSILATISSLRWIALEDCGLRGEFPMGIFHLPKLQFLSVKFNHNLSGYLPEFNKSSRLEFLLLGHTSFSGQLPASIGNLKTMDAFDLKNCSFTGSLPASLNNLTELTTLDLCYNDFSGHIPSLASLSQLTTLSLSFNGFSGQNFPSSLSNLTQLTGIFLTSNHITGHIPSWLMNMTQLTEIYVSHNLLQGPIPSTFSQLTDLTALALVGNNLSGTVEAHTFLSLQKLTSLQLGDNRITFVVTSNHSTNATNFPQLEVLGLTVCNLKAFPEFLRNQNELVDLILEANQIEGQIPEWFWNRSRETLETVMLSDNLLTGFEHHPLLLPWSGVKSFDLSYNMLQGSPPLPPPNTILYKVSNNRLTGEIHPLICNVSSLYSLDLSNNNMTGPIPPCLGNLSNSLSTLMLKGNNFSGMIPDTFMKGSKLLQIDLSENQLEGQLPRSLANCSMLQFLNLAANRLDDVFPSWLGALAGLEVMILRSNKFHGSIESSVKKDSNQFQKLHIVDLSHNRFTGHLPDIQNWRAMKISASNATYLQANSEFYWQITWHNQIDFSMTITNNGVKRKYEKVWSIFTVVDLSSNKFIGGIPGSIGQLQGLQLLNLSNNHLTGSIPPSFENLRNLESLDLSHNMLSGRIPQQLVHLGFLSFFNVSYNHLVGPIPEGKQFNTFQYNSYEGNVGLCGETLSKKCGYTPAPSININDIRGDDSDFSNGVADWIIISLGSGSGLVVGLIIGKYLTTRHHEWFVEKFGKRHDKWVRPIRGGRRN